LNIRKKSGVYCFASVNAVVVDRVNAAIMISFDLMDDDVTPCPLRNTFSIRLAPLALPSGEDHYAVSVFREDLTAGANPFHDSNLIDEFTYALRTDPVLSANPEVPQQGSVQSGIGVIRGWACEAERIEIQF